MTVTMITGLPPTGQEFLTCLAQQYFNFLSSYVVRDQNYVVMYIK